MLKENWKKVVEVTGIEPAGPLDGKPRSRTSNPHRKAGMEMKGIEPSAHGVGIQHRNHAIPCYFS